MTASRRRILARLGAIALAAAEAACAGDPLPRDRDPGAVGRSAQPIIGGEITGGDPAVVALTFAGTDELHCTGTLVSPRVVLTAGHCLDDVGLGQAIGVFIGADLAGSGQRVTGEVAYVHPDWVVGGDDHDLGMVLLRVPVDPTLPVRLNDAVGLDELIGSPYRLVGFGRHDIGEPVADGKKRQGTTTITGTPPGTDVVLSGDADLSVCFGDSGGPGFITVDGAELLAGIHSFTIGDCVAPNGATRVDLYAAGVISPWIQDNDPSCAADELCSRIGCSADPDCEPCGPDGTCAAGDCALPDLDCPTGATGDICRADSQCMSGLCVSWTDDPDYRYCTEPCGAAPDCPSGMSCGDIDPPGQVCAFDRDPPGLVGDPCTAPTDCGSYLCDDGECVIRCDLSDGAFCPSGFECRHAGGDDQFCHGSDEGSCSVGGGGSGGLAAFLLAALFAVRRRRHVQGRD